MLEQAFVFVKFPPHIIRTEIGQVVLVAVKIASVYFDRVFRQVFLCVHPMHIGNIFNQIKDRLIALADVAHSPNRPEVLVYSKSFQFFLPQGRTAD